MSPFTVINESGEDVQVFTPEEVQAEKEAALAQVKQEKDAELEAAQAELKTANEKLGKLESKDFNFATLRKQKEDAESKIEKIAQEMGTKIEGVKKEILEGVSKDYFNEVLGTLAGDDAELKKKIEFQYNRINDSPGTKEEISKKLRDAYTLATATIDTPGAITPSVMSSGGAGKLQFKKDNKFTPEEKAFAQKLAHSGGLQLKEEDFQK